MRQHQSETIMKFSISFIALFFVMYHVACEECVTTCIPKERCKEFGNLSPREQAAWESKYPCPAASWPPEHSKFFGWPAAAKVDNVCCPSAVEASHNSQCAETSFPPKPETGCCGREAPEINDIFRPDVWENDLLPPQVHTFSTIYDYLRRPHYRLSISRPHRSIPIIYVKPPRPHYIRPIFKLRGLKQLSKITLEKRISGGEDTRLTQFPWAVNLEMAFRTRNKLKVYNCGGSLISSRYVLTAAHCFIVKGETFLGVKAILAEYNTRTFSKDCQGEKCIKNLVIKAEPLLHPEYNDTSAINDIALLRLQEHAPYTDYIRPICLPSFNIDKKYSGKLRLPVTGWGASGQSSDATVIKQFTVLNLVPQKICRQLHYPNLFRGQMCANGNDGEDVCNGDSGGPLMISYRGQYQLVGVISSKINNASCGSGIPSLHTNVYLYRDWIYSNMKH